MAKEKQKMEKNEKKDSAGAEQSCLDARCPFHGNLSLRGRIFRGTVIKKFHKRVVIEFEKIIYIRKYERYLKSKTKLHAHLPDCLFEEINIGDYVEIKECRKLSKIISFVVVNKIRSGNNEKISGEAK
jgi:small subunit ribosomal protein S17